MRRSPENDTHPTNTNLISRGIRQVKARVKRVDWI